MSSPLVSIIMPAFNAAKFIEEAIRSVLNQTYSNWELLIINDGSTDETEEKIKQFIDSRIIYFKKLNGGASSARNVGLKNMKGDFFCFLDADDIYPSESIEARIDIFVRSKEELEFVDGTVIEKDCDLQKIIRCYRPSYHGNPEVPLLHLSESCYLGQTWMLRRSRHRNYQMREDLTHGEDFFFLLELSRSGGVYSFTEKTILIYRRHYSSAMSNLDGLNNGYLLVHREIRTWQEVSAITSLIFWIRSRKIMFLSYLVNGKSFMKAVRCLAQWK